MASSTPPTTPLYPAMVVRRYTGAAKYSQSSIPQTSKCATVVYALATEKATKYGFGPSMVTIVIPHH